MINDWLNMNETVMGGLMRFKKTAPDLPAQTRRLLVDKVYRAHYDLGSLFFKKGDFASAWVHLSEGIPAKLGNYKWLIKLVLSFLLGYIISDRFSYQNRSSARSSK